MITNWLNPEILTAYTDEQKGALVPKWKLVPDATGNVLIYDKFWEDEEKNITPIAPYLLVYRSAIKGDGDFKRNRFKVAAAP